MVALLTFNCAQLVCQPPRLVIRWKGRVVHDAQTGNLEQEVVSREDKQVWGTDSELVSGNVNTVTE